MSHCHHFSASVSPRGLVLLVTPMFLATVSASSASPMPKGAFLRRPVHSTSQLRRALHNPTVLRRYEQAFGASASKVKSKLGELRLTSLKKDTVMRVYYRVRLKESQSGEDWGYRTRRVPAGTQVFTDKKGEPILIRVCGNPTKQVELGDENKVSRLPEFSPREAAGKVNHSAPLSLGENAMRSLPPIPPTLEITSILSAPVAGLVPMEPLMPEELPLTTPSPLAIPSALSGPVASPAMLTSATSGLSLTRLGRLPIWLIASGLPSLISGFSGGGGGSALPVGTNGTSTNPITPIVVTPTAVPEPGSLALLLGVMGTGFALRSRSLLLVNKAEQRAQNGFLTSRLSHFRVCCGTIADSIDEYRSLKKGR